MALDRDIFIRAGRGKADAATEVAIAAAKGDFRLFAYSKLVPGIFPAAYGVECRPDLEYQNAVGYFRGMFARSDVISSAEAMQAETLIDQHYSAFATAYNRTIVTDPHYPWRDICRISDNQRSALSGPPSVGDYGYRDLQETASPIDLGEAARRGTLESLKRLAGANRSAINRADAFGLTPLAWAIVYRRGDHARALLEHDAAPSGSPCQQLSTPTSPMQFARALQWREMIDQMRPYALDSMLHDPPILLPNPHLYEITRSIDQSRKRYAARLSGDIPVTVKASVDAAGKAICCKLDPKTGIEPFDQEICSRVLKATAWKPARNEYGEPVPGEGIMRLRIRSPENGAASQ